MSNISIFCKNYYDDLDRAIALTKSVLSFNRDALPLYISVPKKDLILFKNKMGTDNINWLTDEEIVDSNASINIDMYKKLPGALTQQVVKS